MTVAPIEDVQPLEFGQEADAGPPLGMHSRPMTPGEQAEFGIYLAETPIAGPPEPTSYSNGHARVTPPAEPPPDAEGLGQETAQGIRDQEGLPEVDLACIGPSYRVTVAPQGAVLVFRDVRTDGELTAYVSVSLRRRHLFRTTMTLSLTGRDRMARTAADLCGGDPKAWKAAVFAAVEEVLGAEERLGAAIDLRVTSLEQPAGGQHAVRPIVPNASTHMTAPGDAGKSGIARAIAVSVAGGITVIPGTEPVGGPRPVLYVAGEDPGVFWHARSVEAICRGLDIDRASLAEPIILFDARGRPLHRIARALAERAADVGLVILDSQQALLPMADGNGGGIRDRDNVFWNAVDQLERATLIIAHPNRADARSWAKAEDGRIAGSEVNRDRTRMAWRVAWKDEPAVAGTSYRRYTLENTKNNHGPKEAPLAFAAAWQFGAGDDPGVLSFHPTDPLKPPQADLSPQLAEALTHYRAGATTPAPLAEKLGITVNTAKSRLRLLREKDLLEGSQDDV